MTTGQTRSPDPAELAEVGGLRHDAGRRRAAGIYGTILTAAVIATGANALSTLELELTVLVTLVIYWIAEQYAELLGEYSNHGQLPGSRVVLGSLGASFPMVSASFLPLLSLLVARLLGASESGGALIALVVAVALLLYHGYRAGRAADLRGIRLAAVSAVAGLLGIIMVVLKALIQHHHQIH
ncbi:MAG TPA: hypothetical protein VMH41_07980 [Mycobacteriales bacterium]|nr:hypothetical protein [Mycobacteriales bacterium]